MQKGKGLKTELVDSCIGIRSGGTIYIHRHLVNYPLLYEKVMEHERSHDSRPGLRLWEWKSDLKALKIAMSKDGRSFIMQYPKCLMQLLPIQKVGGRWLIDLEGMIISALALAILFSVA